MKKFTLLIQSKCEKNDRKRKYKQRTAWTDTADQMLLEVCVARYRRERGRESLEITVIYKSTM